jgi:Domain of unknown function (DUF4173)
MTRDLVLRGVPQALAVDMWWLASVTDAPPPPPPDRRTFWTEERTGGRAAALAGLVALSDILFYGHAPGLSLAIFAAAVLAAVMALCPGGPRLRPSLVLLAAALPVVDHVQVLSVAFLASGLLVSIVLASGAKGAIGRHVLALIRDLPLRGIQDGLALGTEVARRHPLRGEASQLRSWVFPVGGALILIGLLVQANPIFGEAVSRLTRLDVGSDGIARVLFWVGSALLIWPLLAPRRAWSAPWQHQSWHLPGPNAQSVARGLVLFNAILAVQTGMDAVYLWGGASLPEGMTAAEYAHRGAYPLLVTALLAGGFALAARPFAREDRRLRRLLLLWLGQNVALTISALLRLELYVEAFGLTYLRLHAAIWMAVVAAGLGLTAWQVWRDRPNRWLVIRSAGLGIGVLYACSFVNFAAVIAAENLSREDFDGTYVCDLGPTAAAAIAASGRAFMAYSREDHDVHLCKADPPRIAGWRDWGFRNWRVHRYLDGGAEAEDEDPRRG